MKAIITITDSAGTSADVDVTYDPPRYDKAIPSRARALAQVAVKAIMKDALNTKGTLLELVTKKPARKPKKKI